MQTQSACHEGRCFSRGSLGTGGTTRLAGPQGKAPGLVRRQRTEQGTWARACSGFYGKGLTKQGEEAWGWLAEVIPGLRAIRTRLSCLLGGPG